MEIHSFHANVEFHAAIKSTFISFRSPFCRKRRVDLSHCRSFAISSLQISSAVAAWCHRSHDERTRDRDGLLRRFSTRPDLFLVNRYWCLRVTDVILSEVFHHSRCAYCVKSSKQFCRMQGK